MSVAKREWFEAEQAPPRLMQPAEILERFDNLRDMTNDIRTANWLSKHSRALRQVEWSKERDLKLELLEALRCEVLLGEHRK